MKLIEVTTFFLSGEFVERAILSINSRLVQLVRYNKNNKSVIVSIDEKHMAQMPINKIDAWIRARL